MFSWVDFLTYSIVTAITPGPNNIMSMSCAGRMGIRKSVPFNYGVLCGFMLIMIPCTLFCTLLSALIPKIKLPMMILGAAYMLWLAWKTFRSSSQIDQQHAGGGFISGMLLQFVNIKIYIYAILSLEVYIMPHFRDKPLAIFGFAVLLAVIAFASTLCWGIFGSAFKMLFSKYARATNTVMALLLVYCAVSLFF